jgi:hypothetical protein
VESANVSYDPYLTLGYSSDSDVKLWRDVPDDSLKLDVGATTRMTITEGGSVGIGTTSPAQPLHVNGTVRASRFEDTTSSNTYYADPASTSHMNNLVVHNWFTGGGYGSTYGYVQLFDNEIADPQIVLNPRHNAYSWIKCLRVGIGTSSPSVKFQVGEDGDGTVAAANSWNTFSDARYKEHLVEVDAALEKLESVSGYYYSSRTGSDKSRKIGVVAQEVEQVLPEVVSTDDEGYKSVDYGRLAAVLIEAVKELKAENDLLKERIAKLEER